LAVAILVLFVLVVGLTLTALLRLLLTGLTALLVLSMLAGLTTLLALPGLTALLTLFLQIIRHELLLLGTEPIPRRVNLLTSES
jgi:hypothetical protein